MYVESACRIGIATSDSRLEPYASVAKRIVWTRLQSHIQKEITKIKTSVRNTTKSLV